ncbi:AAA family ATPase [Alishewanella sp. BS5-314]|uniref:AAA family ATPase n=1 Tax=Alishewanella sp. BS5-314 TaxID=2755587 RepID=UPI0021BA9EE9|nr:AAA family ATPase [Alishewanella sp. BS5-314]MCT8127241.1 AAA family ATPase [Alishewanella sp. BS5-314]
MKLDYLTIRSGFKNISNLTVDFDEEHLLTVLVGRNGSGKSNIIEALVKIFRALDLGEQAPFSYELIYSLGAENRIWVKVDADPARGITPRSQHQIEVTEKHDEHAMPMWSKVSLAKVQRDKKGASPYLPKHLFAYYSGHSDRLEDLFVKHRTNFYSKLLKNRVKIEDEVRPLFYAKPYHSQFVLLAFFLSGQSDIGRKFLETQLSIKRFHSAHFVFRKPSWERSKTDAFWGADGVVRQFLDRLLPQTFGLVRTTREETTSLTGKGKPNDFVHLYLPDITALNATAKGLGPKNFFKMLESTLLSELISSVHVKVVLNNDEIVSFSELSEGEQQLLTVFGLLQFTAESDSLFLLDEPDTHLNPAWAAKYHAFLNRFIPNKSHCHIVMVTHHPLAIAELTKDQIQVLHRDTNGLSYAEKPAESPIGMGVNGILTSDMFGMATTLDQRTSKVIEDRRTLLEKDMLSEEDKIELRKLNSSLERLGYGYTHPDEDYRQFLIERKKALQDMELKSIDTTEVRLQMVRRILKERGFSV